MERYEANSLITDAWANGREACLLCVKNGVVLSDEQWEQKTLPDGTSIWDGEWCICVDGHRSPFEFAFAIVWMEKVMRGHYVDGVG